MTPFAYLISYLSYALDNTSLAGLFEYTLILIPTLIIVPLVVYWVVLTGVRLLTNLRI